MPPKKPKKKININSFRSAVYHIMLPRWKRIALGLVIIVLSRVAALVLPAASKFLVDNIFLGGNIEKLPLLLSVVGGAVIVQALGGFLLVKLLSVEAHHLISELRVSVQKHVLSLPLSFFYKERSGAVVARIMSDVEGVRNLIGTGLIQLFGGVLSAVLALYFLLSINVTMTLVSLAILAVFGVVMIKAFSTVRPVFRKRQELNSQVTGRLTETIGGIRVIKSFAAEEREQAVFSQGTQSLFLNVKKSLTATALVTMVTLLLTGVISGVVMGFSSYAVINQEMTSGDFVAYLLYLGFLTLPIVQMSNIGTQITESLAGLDRMNEIYSLKTEYEDKSRTVMLPPIEKEIVFEKVHFSYPQESEEGQSSEEREVINGISFSIKRGDLVALVGSSGSGKSTLASLALSLLKPTKGRIMVDGVDLATVDLKSYRRQLAVVFQDDFFFDGTIRENLLFSKPDASKQEIENAIKVAYVSEFTEVLPGKLNTVIGERGIKLSGGQKQRLSIARAVLANPNFLVLDEATSSLDSVSENFIRESLNKLLKKRTTLVIAHRLSTIKQASKILVVENGKIVESGTHNSLLRKRKQYYKLYTYQAKI